ncbi:MAG: CoA pyrophosphatase [Gemmatimonadaceae bacterium]|nr:CoA pyrophosphatase [Gemmatimonadaceae bacterium]
MAAGADASDASAAARAASVESRIARVAQAIVQRPGALAERDEPYHEAAVALVLREAEDDLELLLIRRAAREGDPWSGQVGLPGGRWDAGDASLEETALRETIEEVGIDVRAHGRVLGALDELRPRTPVLPPIIVRPYVTILDAAQGASTSVEVTPNHEVASWRWVRVGELFAPATRIVTTVEVRDMQLRVDAFQLGDYTVWGMTERILSTFGEIWR